MTRFRSCPSCRGRGQLEIVTTCPECQGNGSITDRQIVAKMGDLLSPEVLDKIAEMIAEQETEEAR